MDSRQFLKIVGAGAAAAGVRPGLSYAAASGGEYRNVLILIELKGANDGLNSVITFDDPLYFHLRPKLAIPRDQIVQLAPCRSS